MRRYFYIDVGGMAVAAFEGNIFGLKKARKALKRFAKGCGAKIRGGAYEAPPPRKYESPRAVRPRIGNYNKLHPIKMLRPGEFCL